jgi:hypothetical protein
MMKSSTLLWLQAGACICAVVKTSFPDDVPAQNPQPKDSGPLGLDFTALKDFDMAIFGPLLEKVQPLFDPLTNSGLLATIAQGIVPSLPLKNKVILQPEIRKSAKRQKSRLGPLTLIGKEVRNSGSLFSNFKLSSLSTKNHHLSLPVATYHLIQMVRDF